MRQFQSRQQQLKQPVQETARPSASAPARAVTAQDIDNEMLDRAAALWTTRRIRSFFLLLERPPRAGQR
ncbi:MULTISPECIES: hypothetical protein [Variovorax]|jgi:hypothetical protein|uniref:Uncharacterized protein n=2 Tax=Variovorax paradoxus TaxID=34073 RepID=A0AAW8EKT8_VARPD|nr:hypothetical protein [Variovorax paradoxus]MBW8716801.1 hypothetical protein [Variovorax paradoxus]MDP9972576.1 hypothetical protein [Variovorax paradoxus]